MRADKERILTVDEGFNHIYSQFRDLGAVTQSPE
jgi:hypothetical protein